MRESAVVQERVDTYDGIVIVERAAGKDRTGKEGASPSKRRAPWPLSESTIQTGTELPEREVDFYEWTVLRERTG